IRTSGRLVLFPQSFCDFQTSRGLFADRPLPSQAGYEFHVRSELDVQLLGDAVPQRSTHSTRRQPCFDLLRSRPGFLRAAFPLLLVLDLKKSSAASKQFYSVHSPKLAATDNVPPAQ